MTFDSVARDTPPGDAKKWEQKRLIFDDMLSTLTAIVPPKPSWTAAEFGIGQWGFGQFYRKHVAKVYGIDIEDYSGFHPGVEFLLSDGNVIPLPDRSVDLVVSHSVLEHVVDLEATLGEINRITKPGGYLFLTVTPFYYAAYGAHLREDGQRLENWEHLIPGSRYYLTDNPLPDAPTTGHHLNKLTSSKFLSAVGTVPWNILSYQLKYEMKSPPPEVDRSKWTDVDLLTRGFKFIGRKNR